MNINKNELKPYLFKNLNALKASKFLLGKLIQTEIENKLTSGIIIETEAYLGAVDKACHAFNYRKTKRNLVMYENGGFIYVYLCYGIHYMLNIVVNRKEIPEAVLIRSVYPVEGIETMIKRRYKTPKINNIDISKILIGPGNVTKGLGIDLRQNYQKIGNDIKIFDVGLNYHDNNIILGPRIGINYAQEWKDVLLNFKLPMPYIDKYFNVSKLNITKV